MITHVPPGYVCPFCQIARGQYDGPVLSVNYSLEPPTPAPTGTPTDPPPPTLTPTEERE